MLNTNGTGYKSGSLERRLSLIAFFIIFLTTVSSGGRGVPGGPRPAPMVPFPSPAVLAAAPDTLPHVNEIVGTFQRKQTITIALVQCGLSQDLVRELVETTRPVYNLSKIKADRKFWLTLSPEGEFRLFRYNIDDDSYLSIYRKDGRFVPELKKFRFDVRVEPVMGVIQDSLFTAVADSGEQETLANELAGLFQWDIDFHTDIQKGDSFRLLVEKKYLNGQFYRYSEKPILAADLVAQKKKLSGFRFEDENGKPAYFAPDGKSLKKSFLKSPLAFIRITSKFSRSRLHPILKIFRPHLGVDYAAPAGTPVRAVAAGTVEFAAWSGGGGRTIKLRHAGGYESSYMHLSRIRVRSGARVSQGDRIGDVGATGLATGPHLDFRIYLRGTPVNPANFVVPPAAPLSQTAMKRFVLVRDSLRTRLDQILLN